MVILQKFDCESCGVPASNVAPFVYNGEDASTDCGHAVFRVSCQYHRPVKVAIVDGVQKPVDQCDGCGGFVPEDSTTADDYTDQNLCADCADMVEVYARGNIVTHIDNCERVYSGHLVLTPYTAECDNCGDTYCTDYHYHPTASHQSHYGCGYDGYCASCQESMDAEMGADRSGILPYSTDVTSYCDPDSVSDGAHIIAGKPLFIGVELESFIDDESLADCCVSNVCRFRCIPTADSSLDENNGVEFIFTHQVPENIVKSIKGLLNQSDIDFLAPPTDYYGLHVHIDKISDNHTLKVQNFVATHMRVLSKIGGRNANTYAKTKCCKKTDIEYARYTSVNATAYTLEYRFPASSEKASIVVNRVLTCYLIHVYCAQINQIQACKFNFARFVLWAHSDKAAKNILALSPSLSGLLSSFLFAYTGV